MTSDALPLPHDITISAETFKLLGDPTRLQILHCLLDHDKCVGHIATETATPQPLVSHHLRLLRGARIVTSRREGRHMFYSLQHQRIACILKDMIHHVTEQEDQNL